MSGPIKIGRRPTADEVYRIGRAWCAGEVTEAQIVARMTTLAIEVECPICRAASGSRCLGPEDARPHLGRVSHARVAWEMWREQSPVRAAVRVDHDGSGAGLVASGARADAGRGDRPVLGGRADRREDLPGARPEGAPRVDRARVAPAGGRSRPDDDADALIRAAVQRLSALAAEAAAVVDLADSAELLSLLERVRLAAVASQTVVACETGLQLPGLSVRVLG